MFLIVLGVILIIVSAVVLKNNATLEKLKPISRLAGLILILLGTVTSCVKQIDAGEVA
jgi:uncharacterized membrane protein